MTRHHSSVVVGYDFSHAARVWEPLAIEVQQELERADVASRINFFVHARLGKPAEEILRVAQEVGADLSSSAATASPVWSASWSARCRRPLY